MPSPLQKSLIFCTLLLLLLPHTLATAITPPPHLTLTHPTNLTAPSAIHCDAPTRFFDRRPKSADCTIAIAQLPQTPGQGTFHNGGPHDTFLLPQERTAGTCSVRVKLFAGTSSVGGYWASIVAHAESINSWCVQSVLPRYKGGWTTYGRDERIVISLSLPDPWEGGEEDVDTVR